MTTKIANEYLSNLVHIITTLPIAFFFGLFLFLVDFRLTIFFSVTVVILLYFMMKKIKTKAVYYGEKSVEPASLKNLYILQGLGSLKEVKVLGKTSFFIRNFNKTIEIIKDVSAKSSFLNHLPRLLIETLFISITVLAILFLLLIQDDPQLIFAKLSVFAFAALKLIPFTVTFSSGLAIIYGSLPNLDILYQELEEDIPLEREIQTKPFKKNLTLEGVGYQYPGHKAKVLENINFTLKKNFSIGLVGGSGSGKTTLVDIILGLLEPTQGRLIIDGKVLEQHGIWTHKIGYIPQHIFLREGSIKSNVALGIESNEIDEKRVWEVLKIAQLDELVKSFSDQLDTDIGESGVRLSGGQRQRIGIARALYHNPEILIMDEATSALDNKTEKDFVDSLHSLKHQLTQVIIAHRLTTVKDCDIIYILDQGKIVDQGTYASLSRRSKYFKKMLSPQKKTK